MNNKKSVWTDQALAFLLYFRDEYVTDEDEVLPFHFIADLIGREIGFYTNRNACIGAYGRNKNSSALYPKSLIADYLAGMDVCYE